MNFMVLSGVQKQKKMFTVNNQYMNSLPIFKIHGNERRQLKKELAELKSVARNFWYFYQLDKDINNLLNCSPSYLMTRKEAEKRFNKLEADIKALEEKLNIKY